MEQRYSEIRELLGKAIPLMLGEMESFEKKIAALEKEVAALKKKVAELQADRDGKEVRESERPKPAETPVIAADAAFVREDVGGAADEDLSVLELEETEDRGEDTAENGSGSTVLGELFVVPQAIGDAAKKKHSWYTDIPGERVEDANMAVSLNDKLFFIRELFDGDEEQYCLIMDRINESSSFDEALMDVRAAFPEWDEESEPVYRFYMAVRRRFV